LKDEEDLIVGLTVRAGETETIRTKISIDMASSLFLTCALPREEKYRSSALEVDEIFSGPMGISDRFPH
jgi:hypothetical protein